MKYATDENNQPVYFLFDNNQRDDRKENPESLKSLFNVSLKGMKQLSEFLKQSGPQKMTSTVEVIRERTRLAACIQNLQERIADLELQQAEVQQCQEALTKYEQEMKNNENFTVEVDERFKEKKITSVVASGGYYFTMEQPAAQSVKKTVTTLDVPLPGIQNTVK